MKAKRNFTSFNAGYLSPLLGGRPDLEAWAAGLKDCSNVIARVQGPLERAAGTVYVTEVKASGDRVWLVPFIFSTLDAFTLEFGPLYIRFYRSRGVLVDGGDVIYEIETPYTADDLTRTDGAFGLRFEQSLDVVYIACATKRPRILRRASNLDWTVALLELDGGPFQDQNEDKTVTMVVSGTLTEGGTVTVTATDDVFVPAHVGGQMELELKDGSDIRAWQTRTKVDVGNKRLAGFKYYECTAVGPVDTSDKPAVTGEEIPVHTRGEYWDGTGEEQKGDGAVGSIGAKWKFLHAGYGWIEITGYTDAQTVTGIVKSALPDELTGDNTYRWSLPAWSDADGWPDIVCFFKERLTFIRGQQVWHSVSGKFDDFKLEEFGVVRPDSAISLSIQSGRGNGVEWAMPTRDILFLGTGAAEHTLGPQTTQIPYGPGNAQQAPETRWGSCGIPAVVVGASPIFVEKTGRRLRMMVPAQEGYDALDLNRWAGLLPARVVSMVWQQTPYEVLWCALANGELWGLTLRNEDKVLGWHKHDVGGLVEALAVIPSPDGTRDDLWMVVQREVDGDVRRYVEYRAEEYEDGADRALAVYTTASLLYSGSAVTTLTGLEHLEGETVKVLVNGAAHPDRTVEGATITLVRAATKAVVGKAMPYKAMLMPIEAGATLGTAQAQVKRINAVTTRLLNSLSGRIGPAFGTTDPFEYRGAGEAMDAPPPLFTGDKKTDFRGDYEGQATIAVEGDDCFPFTLISLIPEVTTYDS